MKILTALFLSLLFLTTCTKDDDDPVPEPCPECPLCPACPVCPVIPPVCDAKGNYAGTATSSTSVNSPLVYKLQENNFALGGVTLAGATTTFGGYRNTCDSVIISSWYNGNGSYYLLKGKFTINRTVLSGTFNNLTTPTDFGTFTLTKQ